MKIISKAGTMIRLVSETLLLHLSETYKVIFIGTMIQLVSETHLLFGLHLNISVKHRKCLFIGLPYFQH